MLKSMLKQITDSPVDSVFYVFSPNVSKFFFSNWTVYKNYEISIGISRICKSLNFTMSIYLPNYFIITILFPISLTSLENMTECKNFFTKQTIMFSTWEKKRCLTISFGHFIETNYSQNLSCSPRFYFCFTVYVRRDEFSTGNSSKELR